MSWARSPSLGPGGMLGDRPSRAWFIDRPLWCIAGRGGEKVKMLFHLMSVGHFCASMMCWGDLRILSEELSVWAGELDTLLLRWDDGWLPGLLWSSKEGAGEGLSGTRSCNPSSPKKNNPNKNPAPTIAHRLKIAVFPLKSYLYNRGDHSGGQALALRCSRHVCYGAEVVHLAHRHGDRGWGQTDRNQGVWHHHEGEFQAWDTWRGCWLLNDAYYGWNIHRGKLWGSNWKTCSSFIQQPVIPTAVKH